MNRFRKRMSIMVMSHLISLLEICKYVNGRNTILLRASSCYLAEKREKDVKIMKRMSKKCAWLFVSDKFEIFLRQNNFHFNFT